jgi:hypothetical protein
MSIFSKPSEPRDHQKGMTWQDQHGRKWGGLFEMKAAADPKGRTHIVWIQLNAVGFVSPLDIPPHVLKPIFAEDGEQVFQKLVVDYAQWKAENAEARRGWRDRARLIAKKMFPNNYGEVMKNPPADLLDEAGPTPLPRELIEAAEVGNRWALGLTQVRPPWLTDEMLDARDALKRSLGWRESAEETAGPVDVSKYPDAPDEAVLVAAGADEELAEPEWTPPPAKGGRRRR